MKSVTGFSKLKLSGTDCKEEVKNSNKVINKSSIYDMVCIDGVLQDGLVKAISYLERIDDIDYICTLIQKCIDNNTTEYLAFDRFDYSRDITTIEELKKLLLTSGPVYRHYKYSNIKIKALVFGNGYSLVNYGGCKFYSHKKLLKEEEVSCYDKLIDIDKMKHLDFSIDDKNLILHFMSFGAFLETCRGDEKYSKCWSSVSEESKVALDRYIENLLVGADRVTIPDMDKIHERMYEEEPYVNWLKLSSEELNPEEPLGIKGLNYMSNKYTGKYTAKGKVTIKNDTLTVKGTKILTKEQTILYYASNRNRISLGAIFGWIYKDTKNVEISI